MLTAVIQHAAPLTNVIFEGNGLLGFVGSYEAMIESGRIDTIQTLAGAGAGSIVAMFFALGYTPFEVQTKLSQLKFTQHKNQNAFYWDIQLIPGIHDPKDYPIALTSSGNAFHAWLQACINERLRSPYATLQSLAIMRNADPKFKNLSLTLVDPQTNELKELSLEHHGTQPIADLVRASVAFAGPFNGHENLFLSSTDNNQNSVYPLSFLDKPEHAAPFCRLHPSGKNTGTLHIHNDSNIDAQIFSWYEGKEQKVQITNRFGNLLSCIATVKTFAKSKFKSLNPFPSIDNQTEKNLGKQSTERWLLLQGAPKPTGQLHFAESRKLVLSEMPTKIEVYETLVRETDALLQRPAPLGDGYRTKLMRDEAEATITELQKFEQQYPEIKLEAENQRRQREKLTELFEDKCQKIANNFSIDRQISIINEGLSAFELRNGHPPLHNKITVEIDKINLILSNSQELLAILQRNPESNSNKFHIFQLNHHINRAEIFLNQYMKYTTTKDYAARQFAENLERYIRFTDWKTNFQFIKQPLEYGPRREKVKMLPSTVKQQMELIQEARQLGTWVECQNQIMALGQDAIKKNDKWFTGRSKETKAYYNFFQKPVGADEAPIFVVAATSFQA